MSWFNQDRVKFPQQWGGSSSRVIQIPRGRHILAGHIFLARSAVHSWFCTSCFSLLLFGNYFTLFIAITITVIVIVVVGCVAIALVVLNLSLFQSWGFVFHSLCGGGAAAMWSQTPTTPWYLIP